MTSIFQYYERVSTMRAANILDKVGSTPIVSVGFEGDNSTNMFAKVESLNPGGSIKDRVAVFIIEEAEKKGTLKKGMTVMEATSGNTGISVAMAGLVKGYPVKIVMPENMSDERKKIIKALNAELILTPRHKNIAGAVEKLNEIRNSDNNIFVVDQFNNPDNSRAHYLTTGPEIWEGLDHCVDIFVSGLGSGGTLMGVGRFLKMKNPDVVIVAVEPKHSSALLGHEPGLHKIEGIGDGFIPDIVDPTIIDEIIEVEDDDAILTSKRLAKEKGLLVGISSGANVWGAMEVQKKFGGDKIIATILADRAERYFSTELFA